MTVFRTLGIIVITATLAGCANAPRFGYSPEKLPAPKPVAGEPEITSRTETYSNQTYYSQLFTDPNTYAISEVTMTIAQRYRLFGSRTDDIPPQTIPVSCTIGANGSVYLETCYARALQTLTDEQNAALTFARSYASVSDFPRYRELPKDTAALRRSVDLTLATPKLIPPNVDLSTGELVDHKQIIIPNYERRLANSYPSRALRREIEGNMVIECQVQTDLSVICQTIEFDPPEDSALFDREVQRAVASARSDPFLKDGRDARGVRFQRRILWRIPGNVPTEEASASSAPTPQE